MSDYETTADLNEQIYYEKLDADRQMAEFEIEGRRAWEIQKLVNALLSEGRKDEATSLCEHGSVGKLDGMCSQGDPRYREDHYRCYNCGAVVDEIMGRRIYIS